MIHIKIKSKKQDNGLWGIPTSVTKYNPYLGGSIDEELCSAAISAYCQHYYTKNLEIRVQYEYIEFFNSYSMMMEHYIKFDNILVDGYNFYYFDSLNEKKIMLRKLKLRNIINKH